ncbi:plasma membrane iron permease [Terfezia boudieri ATCC MYA-4762]|uniref:Plasma membrane iron permease n=1 Tax=Terfezia boudieri ATCC MYA-4762 TaxID=1051890 RepID=A0A3N4LVC8_9PEZI|nr:plasma membrane iron permease [Terfezia boudieri ATCC MYA-4762]
MANVFAVPVFFIVFRETIETSIVVAVLLAVIKQASQDGHQSATYKKLLWQVWIGLAAGVLICLIIGGAMIGAFYSIGKNLWEGTETLYEGIFGLIASIIITVIGAAILRISKLREKWVTKLSITVDSSAQTTKETNTSRISIWSKKYAMFLLPFITVLREGLECVIFVGGVSFAAPATSFPLPVVTGLLGGSAIGWLIYKGGNTIRLQWFLIASTCVLYLVAAGLLSRAAWSFDMYQYNKLVGADVAEAGVGPGSYDIHRTVWHVNCCSPTLNGGSGWGIFSAVLGWQNSATYSSVIVYNVYWIVVGGWFLVQMFLEKKGRYPFMKTSSSLTSRGREGPLEHSMVTGTGGLTLAGGVLSEKEAHMSVIVKVS